MNWSLELVSGPTMGAKFSLTPEPIVIGRNLQVTLPFPEDHFLSSKHLSLRVTSTGVLLTDLGSTNGTLVNDQRVMVAELHAGDIIKAGSLTFRISAEASGQPSTSLSAVAPLDLPAHEQLPSVDATRLVPTLSAPPGKTAAIQAYFASLRAPLYCLLDAARDPSIPTLLAKAQEQRQSLYEGQSAIDLADWAPYLVGLPPGSPLARTLLDRGWGKGWASYFTSLASFEELRHHFRKFLMVQIEGGQEAYFRFYDPRVLRDFLPTCQPNDLAAFFGPVITWMAESEDAQRILNFTQSAAALAVDHLLL